MAESFAFKVVSFAFLVVQVSAISRQVEAPFNEDPIAEASENQGFLEDINFKNFFEEVGLHGSQSAPKRSELRETAPQLKKSQNAPVKKSEGFIPSDPLTGFKASASNNRFTVLSSDDDFYAAESHPYNDYYGFGPDETNPYAASHHNHDYLSPYSASHGSHRRANFEDFGPPKGFFNHEFDFGNSNKGKKGDAKSAQETRPEPKVDEEGIKHDEKTKKCETVHKEEMTCEICKDDFGGFSEHCSHSLQSGKDQKYGNSRRRSHDEDYNPLKHHAHGQPASVKVSQKSASNDQVYQKDDQEKSKPKESPKSHHSREGHSSHSTPHSSPKIGLHHPSHHSFYADYEPSSKTNQNTYHPAPENSFADYFDTLPPEKENSFDSHKNRFSHPSSHAPHSDTKVAADLPSKTEKTSDSKPSHTPVTPKSLPSPKPSSDPHSASEHSPATEDKGAVAIYAKKSVPVKHDVYSQSQPKKVYQTNPESKNKNFGKDHSYDPFPAQSRYNPYTFDDTKRLDGSLDFGHKNLNDYRRHIYSSFYPKKLKTEGRARTADVVKQVHANPNHHYKPLDPVENFKVIGRMVKQFSNKDRSRCKKVTRKGMTCFICPNKHGQLDEDCMYENTDPKQGVHMMYKEEVTY